MNETKKTPEQYEEIYRRVMEYEEQLHEKHQRKIQIGMKVNILLPLVFLLLSFLTDGSKLVFLVLWIVSLFGIAFYLIYIEFTDYETQIKVQEFGMTEKKKNEPESLIGAPVQAVETHVTDKVDAIDNRIEENKQRVVEKIDEKKQAAVEKLEKKKQAAAELLAETKLQAAEKLEDILKENVQEMMEETAVKQNGEKTDKPEDGSDNNNSKSEDSVKEDRNA